MPFVVVVVILVGLRIFDNDNDNDNDNDQRRSQNICTAAREQIAMLQKISII